MPTEQKAAQILSPRGATSNPIVGVGIAGTISHMLTVWFPKYITAEIGDSIAAFLIGVYMYLKHRQNEQVKAAMSVGIVAAADNKQLPGLEAAVEAAKK